MLAVAGERHIRGTTPPAPSHRIPQIPIAAVRASRGFVHGRFSYAGPCQVVPPVMAGIRKPSPTDQRNTAQSGRVWTPLWMQEVSMVVLGMWSGADVCPASKCGFRYTPRAFMEVCGPGPVRVLALLAPSGYCWFSRSRLLTVCP